MRIKTNCPLDAGPGSSSAWYLTRAFKDLGHDIVTGYEADLVINVGGMPYADRLTGVPYFIWDCDSFLSAPSDQILLHDQVFIGGSPEDLEMYPGGTVFLPHAFNEKIHRPRKVKKDFDLVMIGSAESIYEKRNNMVAELAKHFNILHTQSDFGDDYSRDMSRGKLIFNMTLGENNIPMRFFEGMAIGCLVENYNDNLDSLATEGKHYIGYNDEKELTEKIKFYLKRPKLIREISKESRKHALLNHTYKHRARKILEYV